jgi:hypothetical protein
MSSGFTILPSWDQKDCPEIGFYGATACENQKQIWFIIKGPTLIPVLSWICTALLVFGAWVKEVSGSNKLIAAPSAH